MLTTIEKSDKVLIYDFSNFAFLVYFAQGFRELKTKNGLSSGLVYGTLRKIISQVREFSEDCNLALVFALDEFPKHKRELVPSYKMNREKREEDPRPVVMNILSNSKCYFVKSKGQEADDVIATLVRRFEGKDIIVGSADQDLLQLRNEKGVRNYNITMNEFFTIKWFKEKYGLDDWNKITIFKACFGDTSDNIKPALPRVRKKDVLPYINEAKDFEHFKIVYGLAKKTDKTQALWDTNQKELNNNYKIIKLDPECKLLKKRSKPSMKNLVDICQKYEIESLTRKDLEVLLK